MDLQGQQTQSESTLNDTNSIDSGLNDNLDTTDNSFDTSADNGNNSSANMSEDDALQSQSISDQDKSDYKDSKAYELNNTTLKSGIVGVRFATPDKMAELIQNEATDSKLESKIGSIMSSDDKDDSNDALMPDDPSAIRTVGDYLSYNANIIVPANSAWDGNKAVQKKYLTANSGDIVKAKEAFFADYKNKVRESIAADRKGRVKLAITSEFAALTGLGNDPDTYVQDIRPEIGYEPKMLGGQAQVGYTFEGDQIQTTRWAEIKNNIGFIDDNGNLTKLDGNDTFSKAIGDPKYSSEDGRDIIGFANMIPDKDYRGIPLLKAVYDGDMHPGELVSRWDYGSFMRSNRLSRHWYTALITGIPRAAVNTVADLATGFYTVGAAAVELVTGKDTSSNTIARMKAWHTSKTDEEMNSMLAPSGIIDFAWNMAAQIGLAYVTGGLSIEAGAAIKGMEFAGSKAVIGDVLEGVMEASATESTALTAAQQVLVGKLGTGIVYGPMMGYEARREALDRGFSVRSADLLSIASMVAAGAIFANSSIMPFSREGKWLAKANRANLTEVLGKLDPEEELTKETALKVAAEVAENTEESGNKLSLLRRFSSKFKGKFPKLMKKLIKADEQLGEKIAAGPGGVRKLWWEAMSGSGTMAAVSMANAALKTIWSIPAMVEYRNNVDQKSLPYFWTPEDTEFWKEWAPQFMQTVVMGAAGGVMGNIFTSAFGNDNMPPIFTGKNSEDLTKLIFNVASGDKKAAQTFNEVLLTIDKATKEGLWASKKMSIEVGDDGNMLSVRESKNKISQSEAFGKIIKQQLGALMAHASGFKGTFVDFLGANPELQVQLNSNDMLWERYKVAFKAQKSSLGGAATPEVWQSYINGGSMEFEAYIADKTKNTKDKEDAKDEVDAESKVKKANETKVEDIPVDDGSKKQPDSGVKKEDEEVVKDAVEVIGDRADKYSKAQIRDYESKLESKKESAAIEAANKFKIPLTAARQFIDASDKLDNIFSGREIGEMVILYHLLNSKFFDDFMKFASTDMKKSIQNIPEFFHKLLASDEEALKAIGETNAINSKNMIELQKKINAAKTFEDIVTLLNDNAVTLEDGKNRVIVDDVTGNLIDEKLRELFNLKFKDSSGDIKLRLLNIYGIGSIRNDKKFIEDKAALDSKGSEDVSNDAGSYSKEFIDAIDKFSEEGKTSEVAAKELNSIVRKEIYKTIEWAAADESNTGIKKDGEDMDGNITYQLNADITEDVKRKLGKLLIWRDNINKLSGTIRKVGGENVEMPISEFGNLNLVDLTEDNIKKSADYGTTQITTVDGLLSKVDKKSVANTFVPQLAAIFKDYNILSTYTIVKDFRENKIDRSLITDPENDLLGVLLRDFDVDSYGNVVTRNRLLFKGADIMIKQYLYSALKEIPGVSNETVESALKFLTRRMETSAKTSVEYLEDQVSSVQGVKIFDNVDELNNLIAKIALRSAMVDAYSNTDVLAKLGTINNYNAKIFNDIDFFSPIKAQDALAFSKTLNRYIIDPSEYMELSQKYSENLIVKGSAAEAAYEAAYRKIFIMKGILQSSIEATAKLMDIHTAGENSANPKVRLNIIKHDSVVALEPLVATFDDVFVKGNNPTSIYDKVVAEVGEANLDEINSGIKNLSKKIGDLKGNPDYTTEDMKDLGKLFNNLANTLYRLTDNAKISILDNISGESDTALLIAMMVGNRESFVDTAEKFTKDTGKIPTMEQDLSSFIVYSLLSSNFTNLFKGKLEYKNVVRILGTQGAGKTYIVLPLAIKAFVENNNINPSDAGIIASAYAHEQAQLVKKSLENISIKYNGNDMKIIPDEVISAVDLYKRLKSAVEADRNKETDESTHLQDELKGIRVIIIDEATLISAKTLSSDTEGDLNKFIALLDIENRRRVQDTSENKEGEIKVIVIGDPNQGGFMDGMPTFDSDNTITSTTKLTGKSDKDIGKASTSQVYSTPELHTEFRYNVADIHAATESILKVVNSLSPYNNNGVLGGADDPIPKVTIKSGTQNDGRTLGGVKLRTDPAEVWKDSSVADSIMEKLNNEDKFTISIIGYTMGDIPAGSVKDALNAMIKNDPNSVVFRTIDTIQGSEVTYVLGKLPDSFLAYSGRSSQASARWRFFSMIIGRATDYVDLAVDSIAWDSTEASTIYRIGAVNRDEVIKLWKNYYSAWTQREFIPSTPKEEDSGKAVESKEVVEKGKINVKKDTTNTEDKVVNKSRTALTTLLKTIQNRLTKSQTKLESITEAGGGINGNINLYSYAKEETDKIAKLLVKDDGTVTEQDIIKSMHKIAELNKILNAYEYNPDIEDNTEYILSSYDKDTEAAADLAKLLSNKIAISYTEQLKGDASHDSKSTPNRLLAWYTEAMLGIDHTKAAHNGSTDAREEFISKIHKAIFNRTHSNSKDDEIKFLDSLKFSAVLYGFQTEKNGVVLGVGLTAEREGSVVIISTIPADGTDILKEFNKTTVDNMNNAIKLLDSNDEKDVASIGKVDRKDGITYIPGGKKPIKFGTVEHVDRGSAYYKIEIADGIKSLLIERAVGKAISHDSAKFTRVSIKHGDEEIKGEFYRYKNTFIKKIETKSGDKYFLVHSNGDIVVEDRRANINIYKGDIEIIDGNPDDAKFKDIPKNAVDAKDKWKKDARAKMRLSDFKEKMRDKFDSVGGIAFSDIVTITSGKYAGRSLILYRIGSNSYDTFSDRGKLHSFLNLFSLGKQDGVFNSAETIMDFYSRNREHIGALMLDNPTFNLQELLNILDATSASDDKKYVFTKAINKLTVSSNSTARKNIASMIYALFGKDADSRFSNDIIEKVKKNIDAIIEEPENDTPDNKAVREGFKTLLKLIGDDNNKIIAGSGYFEAATTSLILGNENDYQLKFDNFLNLIHSNLDKIPKEVKDLVVNKLGEVINDVLGNENGIFVSNSLSTIENPEDKFIITEGGESALTKDMEVNATSIAFPALFINTRVFRENSPNIPKIKEEKEGVSIPAIIETSGTKLERIIGALDISEPRKEILLRRGYNMIAQNQPIEDLFDSNLYKVFTGKLAPESNPETLKLILKSPELLSDFTIKYKDAAGFITNADALNNYIFNSLRNIKTIGELNEKFKIMDISPETLDNMSIYVKGSLINGFKLFIGDRSSDNTIMFTALGSNSEIGKINIDEQLSNIFKEFETFTDVPPDKYYLDVVNKVGEKDISIDMTNIKDGFNDIVADMVTEMSSNYKSAINIGREDIRNYGKIIGKIRAKLEKC